MGLMDAQDKLGKQLQEQRDAKKAEEAAQAQAKEDAKKELDQHEKNKEQGMI